MLDKQDGRALLVSKYALDCQPYNTEDADVTWETCTLRKWLNGTFLQAAFSVEEQKQIPTVTVTAGRHPDSDVAPGNNTRDKVFLLAYAEATQYFPTDADRMCAPTAYAIAQGTWTDDEYTTSEGKAACWWWLRSAGDYSFDACSVNGDGWVSDSPVDITNYGIRPALWLNLES